jgi:carbamate kinase
MIARAAALARRARGRTRPPQTAGLASLDPRLVVVAIGGNATYPPNIKGTAEEQFKIIGETCEQLIPFIERGLKLVLTHGNGPVIGNILERMAATAPRLQPMPMDVCVAHSQGGIGYMIQNSLANVLMRHGIRKEVACIITQVEVAANDPAFHHPSKPIGRFQTAEEAARLRRETGWDYIEDSGRGYRRVVPSPQPREIVEIETIRALLDAGAIPIAVGGGGIPVVRAQDGHWRGVAAVIDKDLATAVLAARLGAGTLIILTGVDQVALDFDKPTRRFLDQLTREEAEHLLAAGQFPEGSMGPKIEAALRYLKEVGGRVVITSLRHAVDALDGTAGTSIAP